MPKLARIFFGGALAALVGSASHAAPATPPQRDGNIARYCTSCATVQSVRKSGSRFELTVRFASGNSLTLMCDNDPGFHPGDKVRMRNGILTRDQ